MLKDLTKKQGVSMADEVEDATTEKAGTEEGLWASQHLEKTW